MPRFSVDPDDLTASASVADGAAETLRALAAGVVAAGHTVAGAAGPEGVEVGSAFTAYVGVDGVTAAALGEAGSLLGRALAGAGATYAQTEAAFGGVGVAAGGRSSP